MWKHILSVHSLYRCNCLCLHRWNNGSTLWSHKLLLQLTHAHTHCLWCGSSCILFCALDNLSLVAFIRISWRTLLTFMGSCWQKTRTNGEPGPSNYFYFSYEQWEKALKNTFGKAYTLIQRQVSTVKRLIHEICSSHHLILQAAETSLSTQEHHPLFWMDVRMCLLHKIIWHLVQFWRSHIW